MAREILRSYCMEGIQDIENDSLTSSYLKSQSIACKEVLSSICPESVALSYTEDVFLPDSFVKASVSLQGAVSGQVSVFAPLHLIKKLSSWMIHLDLADIDDDLAFDSFKEFCNIFVGRTHQILPQALRTGWKMQVPQLLPSEHLNPQYPIAFTLLVDTYPLIVQLETQTLSKTTNSNTGD